MAQPQPAPSPPRGSVKQLPNIDTSSTGLPGQMNALSANPQSETFPTKAHTFDLNPVGASPNDLQAPLETVPPTSASRYPAPLPPSQQWSPSSGDKRYSTAGVHPGTALSLPQIQMPDPTRQLTRVVTDRLPNPPLSSRPHIAVLRNGVPHKMPYNIPNTMNRSIDSASAPQSSRDGLYKANQLAQYEDGRFEPLQHDHEQDTESNPRLDYESHTACASAAPRNFTEDSGNSASAGQFERGSLETITAPRSPTQSCQPSTVNPPSSQIPHFNAANNTTGKSSTALKYPFLSSPLQGARKAMGEDSWDIYVQLIEKYVTGTIDENELERETAKEFLMSDHRAKKKLRRLTEKMVKDKLEADKRSTENESTVGGDV